MSVKLPKTAIRIASSKDYADIDGSIYTEITNYRGKSTKRFIKKTQRAGTYGYMYCGIYDNGLRKCKTRRVNRVIAETFIPNPNNLPCVGHRNNIKSDNSVSNLYWTSYSDNSKKAVKDGLLVNAKGADDSQSKPVVWFDSRTNKHLGTFGSIREAVRKTGISQSTISRQARYHRPTRKPTYFRFQDDDTTTPVDLIGEFDYDSDRLLKTYFSKADAARQTNTNEKTVGQQCNVGKPKHKFSNTYFAYVKDKCESTIEQPKAK